MPIQPSSIAEAVRNATARIQAADVGETDRLDAELLVGHVTGFDRVRIRTHGDTLLTVEQQLELEELVTRRTAGEPVAYLTGAAWFYGREFTVDRRVLVPRPETELLVELALGHLENWPDRGHAPTYVADVCTGSGCVGISIAAESDERFGVDVVQVVGTDISSDALDVAQVNVDQSIPDVILREGDLLAPVSDLGPFAVIVANPPYVDDEDDEALDPNVRAHEPHVALFTRSYAGGVSGIVDRLAAEAMELLEPAGMLAIEHGHGQGSQLRDVLQLRGFVDVRGVTDLAGIDRVVVGFAPDDDDATADDDDAYGAREA